jgi:hypothetical protein
MTALDRILPTPRLLEIDTVDLALPPDQAWEVLRHGDLGRSPLVRALFALRTLPDRVGGRPREESTLRIDALTSTPERPGFAVLHDERPREVVVGAIGKVWEPAIPFRHAPTADAFTAFAEPGYVKVAWAIQLAPLGASDTRVTVEVRVDATSDEAWSDFRRYFLVIGPASRFIRRSVLSALAGEHGTPGARANERPMPGDELLPDAAAQMTHGVTIQARPEQIWPWLVQMGCRRAGFYSVDLLDNDSIPSAREIHPEWQTIQVGDMLPATTDGDGGFEVLCVEPNHALVLGGLFDAGANRQLPFVAVRPDRFWQVTWAFVLEPLDAATTRLQVRARAAFPASGALHATWIRPVHHLMETAQLRHLAARVEGRESRDDWREWLAGAGGAARMAAALLTPFRREARGHWGVDAATAARALPGDEIVPAPRWSWTHGVEIDAPASAVWPWVAQLGADRGGFYSYQWLENLVGCEVRNAERVHPEWAVRQGDAFRLHPDGPALTVVALEPGAWFVVAPPPETVAPVAPGQRLTWVDVSWLFLVEPLGPDRCRLISRYRCATSPDLATRLTFGPALMEPVGFAMDRRMLLGIKERAERAAQRQPVAV